MSGLAVLAEDGEADADALGKRRRWPQYNPGERLPSGQAYRVLQQGNVCQVVCFFFLKKASRAGTEDNYMN